MNKPTLPKFLNGPELIEATHILVREERRLTLEIIEHLREIYTRKIYLERGFPSLFEMCTKEFGYSASAAQRRIETMRLTFDVPEINSKITDGSISLTAAASIQSFLTLEKKNNREYSKTEKLQLIQICEGKSTREIEKEFVKINPLVEKKESIRVINENLRQLNISITSELEEKLVKLKNIYSHQNPTMSFEELIGKLADMALEKFDRGTVKKEKKSKSLSVSEQQKKSLPAPVVEKRSSLIQKVEKKPSRYVPVHIQNEVWKRNAGKGCEFTDSSSGRECRSKHLLQIDHLIPFCVGGTHALSNLRILCAQHNRATFKNLPISIL